MERRRLLFIINPISGIGKKDILPQIISDNINQSEFAYTISYTKYKKHGAAIAQEEKDNFDAIIAIGGDGTVSEIGSMLLHSNCALGIIPTGSGNGIARHLQISRDIKKAIAVINRFNCTTIDTGICNNKPFIGVCGFGFDAHIAEAFEKYHKRGLSSYAKLISKLYSAYKPPTFKIKNDQFSIRKTALLACVSNSSEYGNGFAISPHSEMQDGQFELILIDKFKLWSVPAMLSRFFTKKIDHSKHHTAIQFNDSVSIIIEERSSCSYHLDGEHLISDVNKFTISIQPKSLKILI